MKGGSQKDGGHERGVALEGEARQRQWRLVGLRMEAAKEMATVRCSTTMVTMGG